MKVIILIEDNEDGGVNTSILTQGEDPLGESSAGELAGMVAEYIENATTEDETNG